MAMATEEFLLQLLQACAALAPEPLYPVRFAREQNLDRDKLDMGLEELRRRGLVKLTDWMKDGGQGYAPTDAGQQALMSKRLPTGRAAPVEAEKTIALTHYERGETVRRSVFEPTPPYVVRILLAANLLYFCFGAFYASNNQLDVSDYLRGVSRTPDFTTDKVLSRLGALRRDKVLPGPHQSERRPEFERILLFCFLHIGLLHLFMNMYFLYSIAPIIESMWGSLRFLALYAIAGIVSGCVVLQYDLFEQQINLTAGASGCLFGIFMALLVWFYFNRNHLPEGLIQDWSRNLAMNAFLLFAINFFPGVSWQGHLGGAIGGLLAALLLHLNRFHPSPVVRFLALAALPIIPLAFFLAVLWQARQAGLF